MIDNPRRHGQVQLKYGVMGHQILMFVSKVSACYMHLFM